MGNTSEKTWGEVWPFSSPSPCHSPMTGAVLGNLPPNATHRKRSGGSEDFMTDDPNSPEGPSGPVSLLPYEKWMVEAHRDIMLKALEHVQREGLPGEHHFYLTFRTNLPGVEIPASLRARYPQEMTIVLQHQYRNLHIDRADRAVSVDLSFGGVSSTLVIPFKAIIAFTDPSIELGLRFPISEEAPEQDTEEAPHPAEVRDFTDAQRERPAAATEPSQTERKEAEVVSLAAFRRKPTAQPPQDGKE